MSSRGYCGVGLDNVKHNINIGSALRACSAYGAAFMAISGTRAVGNPPTDTTGAIKRIPMFKVVDLHAVIPHGCVPVAVEIIEGSVSLMDYKHPERAFYVFGAEDHTLGQRVLGWCRDVVHVPTAHCMNLAATVNVVLYDRAVKRA